MSRRVTLLLPLLACASEPTPTGAFASALCGRELVAPQDITQEFEVDCTGMHVFRLGDTSHAVSRLRLHDGNRMTDDLEVTTARCQLLMVTPTPSAVANLGLRGISAGQTGLSIVHEGRVWTVQDGCMKHDSNGDPTKGLGEYDAIVFEKDEREQPTGRWGRAKGPIDWCSYGQREDCPIQVDQTLPKTLSLGLRDLGRDRDIIEGQGRLTGCRAVIDRAKKGVRVDLSVGIWKGMPVTDIAAECTGGVRFISPASKLSFRDGGVEGPGTYTRRSASFMGERMPSFQLETHVGWELLDNLSTACVTGARGELRTTEADDETICTYTIQESPGRFELSCTPAPTAARLSNPTDASLTLAADCDVVLR